MSTRVKTLRRPGARHDHRPRHRAKNLARGTSAVGHVSDFVFPSSCSAPATGDGSRPVTVGGAAARPHRRRSPVPRSPWGARRPVRTPPLSRPRGHRGGRGGPSALRRSPVPVPAQRQPRLAHRTGHGRTRRHADRTTKVAGAGRHSRKLEPLTTLDGRRGRSRVEICPIWLSYFGARQIDRERG